MIRYDSMANEEKTARNAEIGARFSWVWPDMAAPLE